MAPIRQTATGVAFEVRVQPWAKRDAITGSVGDTVKIAVTAPALEGRANDACIAFVAKLFQVPRASVTIAAGERGRRKLIHVAGLSAAAAQEVLDAALKRSTP